ncbi:MAG: helix-turn-helix domain-containing protein [Eubacteriales bacterium]
MAYFNHLYKADPQELPSRARAVYMYLKDRTGTKKECWPSVKTIGKDLAISPRTVQRALKDLELAGILQKEARYRENGSRSSNLLNLTR